MADLDMLKEIPGYKLILKSVLKSQIQLLLEQLSDQTGEESIILTASVHDGSLSHLGSCTGKGFLEGREEIKSQFLGYCLKTHHRAKTSETRGTPYQRSQPHKKSRVQSTYLGSQQNDPSSRYTSQNSPNSSFDSGGGGGSGGGPLQLPSFSGTDSRYGIDNNSVEMKGQIRTSPDLSDHDSSVGQIKQEPSSTPVLPVSTSLSSGLAQGYSHDQSSSHSVQQDSESEIDTQNIKIEADEENEEELEITGVEMVSGATPENWGQRAGLGPSTQESGLELDMPDQADYSYPKKNSTLQEDDIWQNSTFPSRDIECPVCHKVFNHKGNFRKHYRIHTGEKPFACDRCERRFNQKVAMQKHRQTHKYDKIY